MAALTACAPLLLNPVKVNIRLCGSIPRDEMGSLTKTTPYEFDDSSPLHTIENKIDSIESRLCSQLSKMQQQDTHTIPLPALRRVSTSFEAPSWAVPASGEARLEPVCESIERQLPVDLTSKSVFRIGRSPQSDVQLLHLTSSRRHALLFHHSNGSCYVVDCGSAHGTYVNGVRINSPPESGLVVPHRVRRGSMIRFGGPGAPVYMLKSFAFDLEEMKGYSVSSTPTTSPFQPSLGAVVQHNTRLNALGKTAKDTVLLSLSSKRSFDSVESFESAETYGKRQRCSSPFLSQEEPMRLVSPDMCCQPNKRRRVSFSNCPPRIFYPSLVTPDLSCDETDSNENDCDESV